MSKIFCFIYTVGSRYKPLASCAVNSFKKWHPNIEIIWDYHETSPNSTPVGISKFETAYNFAVKNDFDRVIILGSDTITCSYLDDFIDNKEDVLCTLDYPYQLVTSYVKTPPGDSHVNADVVCFNNLNALKEVINLSKKYSTNYYEQGGLNQLLYNSDNSYTYKIVDGPYDKTKHIYNARAKGNIAANPGTKPWKEYTLKFYVKDNKLFTHDNKQIKVWHFCEGLGGLSDSTFNELLNYWRKEWFNKETKDFLNYNCECKDFFI